MKPNIESVTCPGCRGDFRIVCLIAAPPRYRGILQCHICNYVLAEYSGKTVLALVPLVAEEPTLPAEQAHE